MIEKFDGEYAFLSNFSPSEIEYEGIIYPTVEHAFQAAKTMDMAERQRIANLSTPGEAKRAGRRVALRPDWETIKDDVMYNCLCAKFKIPELREKLIATRKEWLVEGNTWHDNYWGDCSCEKCRNIRGRNVLGETLCVVRNEILTEEEEIMVVVDMQVDFVKGVLGNDVIVATVPAVVNAVRTHLMHHKQVVFTRDTHHENYMNTQEGKNLPVPHCFEGTDGWQIIEELRPYAEKCLCISKPTFGSLDLMTFLAAKDMELKSKGRRLSIKYVGVCTGICVISNAMLTKAFLPEAKVTVVGDCCACVTPESHANALEAMKMCQIEVI